MATQAKATKCITVTTPYGMMDLTLFRNHDYAISNDNRTQATYLKIITELQVISFRVVLLNEKAVSIYDVITSEFKGWFNIFAHHGDKFPEQRK